MSDKYIQIASFKFGLDKRREELVSQPGVLVTCENAHVNSGGEIEKRKAFVPNSVLLPTNSFGLQDTDEGLMVFGSDAAPSTTLPTGVVYQQLLPGFLGANAFETVTLAGTAAANGVFIQNGQVGGKPFYSDTVVAPTKWIKWNLFKWVIQVVVGPNLFEYYYSLDDVATPDLVTTWVLNAGVDPKPHLVLTKSPTVAKMTKVVYSSNFLGKAFVIAQFGDVATGTYVFTLCFYDGELVASSRNGLVLLNSGGVVETVSNLSQDLADQVNAIPGWTGIANTDVAADLTTFAAPGCTIIESPGGISFDPAILDADGNPLWSSTLGVMSRRFSDSIGIGTGEIPARAAFEVNGGLTGTIDVQAPLNRDGTGTATLIGTPLNSASYASFALLAAAVGAAINAKTVTTGYSASVTGAAVTVVSPRGFGNVTFNLTVSTTLTLTTIPAGATGTMTVTFIPNVWFLVPASPGRHTTGTTRVIVTNPHDPPTYLWEESDPSGTVPPPNGPSGIEISHNTGQSVNFSAFIPAKGIIYTGYFKCTVHSVGATPNPASAVIQVSIGAQ